MVLFYAQNINLFLIDVNAANDNLNREMLSVLRNPQKLEDMYKDLIMDGSATFSLDGCTVGTDSCPPNEECIQNYPKSRAGTCKCKVAYLLNFCFHNYINSFNRKITREI